MWGLAKVRAILEPSGDSDRSSIWFSFVGKLCAPGTAAGRTIGWGFGIGFGCGLTIGGLTIRAGLSFSASSIGLGAGRIGLASSFLTTATTGGLTGSGCLANLMRSATSNNVTTPPPMPRAIQIGVLLPTGLAISRLRGGAA